MSIKDADRDGTPVADYQAVLDQFSEELSERVALRADESTFNWLMQYGMPDTPAKVNYLVTVMLKSGVMWAVVKGFAELTETGKLPEDELTKRREAKDQAPQPARRTSFAHGQYL